ncbi:MAG: hypothetical protein NSGCLCUN01_02732 [uncultured Clostridium sp.]
MKINFIHKRVALYIRVSTEEQALHGYSLEAQKETLTIFAKENNMKIFDYYIDEGISARKKYTTRKEFMRMLEDVKQNKIDIILFIKLDRWFRSVKDYYKIQEILEEHNVSWKAVLEDYDTATANANGRLHINIKLSIAQDESDRTSERIKYVFENKIKNGEVITASTPLGYKIENKKLIINPDKVDIVKGIFDKFNSTHAIRTTTKYVEDTFNLHLCSGTIKKILKNTIYIGEYRNVKGYCPAIIDKSLFNNVQINLKRSVKAEPKYTYIFSSIIYCASCNHIMSGYSAGSGQKYRYYRCRYHFDRRLCDGITISEIAVEKYLINNITTLLRDSLELKTDYSKISTKKKIDKSSIKRKLSKLKDLYLNDLISLDEYKKDYERYNKLLNAEEELVKKSSKILLNNLDIISSKEWITMYNSFSNEDKRIFWRGFIKKILVDDKRQIAVEFL